MKSVALPLAVAALLAVSASAAPQEPASKVIQKIIVKVNGEIFTQTDLEQRQIQALREKNRDARTPQSMQDEAIRQQLAEVTPDILVEAIDELLLVQRGRELGARFTDDHFKNAIENIKKQNKLDEAGLKAAMAQEGLSFEDLRQSFERTYLMQAVQQMEIMRGMTLTEEEVRQYYQKNQAAFMKPATLMLREIFVAVPAESDGTVNVAADEAAKAKIASARERALKGEDFAKLVTEVSESASKANGGLVGPVVVDEMVPSLRDALAKLKPADVTEPIRAKGGYQIFKLESRTTAEPEPFDKVKDDIRRRIYDERVGGETNKYLAKLRAQALIEWKDEKYREMYLKRTADKKGSGNGQPRQNHVRGS